MTLNTNDPELVTSAVIGETSPFSKVDQRCLEFAKRCIVNFALAHFAVLVSPTAVQHDRVSSLLQHHAPIGDRSSVRLTPSTLRLYHGARSPVPNVPDY